MTNELDFDRDADQLILDVILHGGNTKLARDIVKHELLRVYTLGLSSAPKEVVVREVVKEVIKEVPVVKEVLVEDALTQEEMDAQLLTYVQQSIAKRKTSKKDTSK